MREDIFFTFTNACVFSSIFFQQSDFLLLVGGLAMIYPCAGPLLNLFPDLSK